MSELLKSFDSYNEFEKSSYFTLLYDTLASTLSLEIVFEESKKGIKDLLELLELNKRGYTLVFKDWNTEDSCNADFSLDFPYQYLYKSNNKKCIVWISLQNETLNVHFYYDCKDLELEETIIQLNHKIRTNYGLSRTPVFKVLTNSHSRFDTEDVRTEITELNLNKNYNSDFKYEYDIIQDSIVNKKSGLIMLYGKPGTGKTTFIKSLITSHKNANFIFVQNEFVNKLLDPDFISFLLKQRNSILIIEDAEKVITTRDSLKGGSVVSTILQLTDGLFSDYLNIKIICTFNTSLSKIDNALLRKGRILSKYEFKALDIDKTNKLLTELQFQKSEQRLTVAEIYNMNQEDYANLNRNKIGF